MQQRARSYANDGIEVTFDVDLCIHAGECVRGLPPVFDTAKRPWIQPEHAPADEIAEVVQRCPSGALTYRRIDGGAEEQPQARTTVVATRNGPLYVRGDLEILAADRAELRRATRVALCRCGMSERKPYCDSSHQQGFEG